jgi:hypothetical protein
MDWKGPLRERKRGKGSGRTTVRGSEEIGKIYHNNEGQGGSGIRVRRGRKRVQDVESGRRTREEEI